MRPSDRSYAKVSGTRDSAPIDRLPKWLLSIPLVVHWLLLSLRYRSMTLPTVVNPRIATGGLVGESKLSYLRQVDPAFGELVARAVGVLPGSCIDNLRAAAGLAFPLVAKPDIGWCGYGVRQIADADALRLYARDMPVNARIVLQELVAWPGEAGLQYVRGADQRHGKLIALTLRHHPFVVGDGRTRVDALIEREPRTIRKRDLYRSALGDAGCARIPARGEIVRLTFVASARVGARYEDGTRFITQALSARIDAIARSMGDFHFGRFDVRFADLRALQAGRFKIIEINGAGAEAIQFWDPKYTLRESFRGVYQNHRRLFALADGLRRRGHRPISFRALAAAHVAQQRLIRNYPPSN